MAETPERSRSQRSDAAMNRAHILRTAGRLLVARPRATMGQVAAAANVSRGTLYRHFPNRSDLLAAVDERSRAEAEESEADRLRPAGELVRSVPTPLSIADLLNKVPPTRSSPRPSGSPGVDSAAVYLVDLDGQELRRFGRPSRAPVRCGGRSAAAARPCAARAHRRRLRGGRPRRPRLSGALPTPSRSGR